MTFRTATATLASRLLPLLCTAYLLVMVIGGMRPSRPLMFISDLNSGKIHLPPDPGGTSDRAPSWSPDGRQIVFTTFDANSDTPAMINPRYGNHEAS